MTEYDTNKDRNILTGVFSTEGNDVLQISSGVEFRGQKNPTSLTLPNLCFHEAGFIACIYINRVSYINPQFTFTKGKHFEELFNSNMKCAKNTGKMNKYPNKRREKNNPSNYSPMPYKYQVPL